PPPEPRTDRRVSAAGIFRLTGGFSVVSREEYLRLAAECRAVAETMDNPSSKAQLLATAAAWRKLAEFATRKSNDRRRTVVHLRGVTAMKSELRAALVAAITAGTVLAPAQGRANFIFQDFTASNPGNFTGSSVTLAFNFSTISLFDTSQG